MEDTVNILVIDTDRDMVEMLTGWLRARGYTVHFCYSADKARSIWLERKPELVIAEVKQSGVDVMAICRELRVQHDALVLAVTEEYNATIEAHCLETGADAFLPKPFPPKLLLAHLHALSRRVRSTLQRQPSSLFTIGAIRFDASRNEVKVNGKTAHLTPTESRILQILAVNVGDVCTQNQIVTHAWGYGEEGDTYLIKAHIRHLREKIELMPSKPRYIRTVPGVGYTLKVSGAPMPEMDDDASASESLDQQDGSSDEPDAAGDDDNPFDHARANVSALRASPVRLA
jgi:DNA-binding response OmpR family regulator